MCTIFTSKEGKSCKRSGVLLFHLLTPVRGFFLSTLSTAMDAKAPFVGRALSGVRPWITSTA